MKKLYFLLTMIALNITQSFGQNEKMYNHAIQTGPIGLAMGNYGANYELIVKQKHGIVLGGSVYSGQGDDGYNMNFQYRKHKMSEKGSSFWGIFFKYSDINSEFDWKEKGKKENFKFSSESFVLGPYWGKRWIWKSGFCVLYNFGYGINDTTFEWKDKIPEHRKLIEGLHKFFSGFQAELSIGFYF